MATEKYSEEKRRIARVAFRLFQKNGFKNTSIKEIADASGIRKSLFQYYFPKKEMLISLYITKSLDFLSDSFDEFEKEKELDTFNKIFLLGYFLLWYMTSHDSMKYLKYDIFSSNEYTAQIIEALDKWAFGYFDFSEEIKKVLSDTVTFAVGGAFEYIYIKLKNDEKFSVDMMVDTMVNIMSPYLGIETAPIKVEDYLTDEWLEQKAKQLDKMMFAK